ncbi:hypothetical protein A2U01_0075653, partial [Trifolium medium]|nr:hypothetical protein [Trifolium medium]
MDGETYRDTFICDRGIAAVSKEIA